MIVETRKTANGTEYWDTEEKRVRFVKAGDTPSFDVTVDPPSMLIGVDLAKGSDMTAIDGKIIRTSKMLEDLKVPELHAFAEEAGIEIPEDVKKRKDIIAYIKNWTGIESPIDDAQ